MLQDLRSKRTGNKDFNRKDTCFTKLFKVSRPYPADCDIANHAFVRRQIRIFLSSSLFLSRSLYAISAHGAYSPASIIFSFLLQSTITCRVCHTAVPKRPRSAKQDFAGRPFWNDVAIRISRLSKLSAVAFSLLSLFPADVTRPLLISREIPQRAQF